MSIFDFHKHNLSLPLNGPQYLRSNLTTPGDEFSEILTEHEGRGHWFGQLTSSGGERKFELHYDGWLDEGNTTIAPATDDVLKLVAIPANTSDEILVFDKALYGWGGFIANVYQQARLIQERAIHPYPSSDEPGLFSVLLMITYSEHSINKLKNESVDGKVKLGDGSVVSLQDAFDNGFDHFSVYALDRNNQLIEVVSQKLL